MPKPSIPPCYLRWSHDLSLLPASRSILTSDLISLQRSASRRGTRVRSSSFSQTFDDLYLTGKNNKEFQEDLLISESTVLDSFEYGPTCRGRKNKRTRPSLQLVFL